MSAKIELPRRTIKDEPQSKEEVQVEDTLDEQDETEDLEYDGIKVIQEFMLSADIGESPIDINLSRTIPISLPPLQWHHHDLPPKKMKCTNTGHTLILSAKWHQERPHLSGGPLFSNYVFSQLHFHWGKNDMEGSEHRVDGSQQPLEMHAVLFKSCYLTQEAALKKKDGIVVLVYFFKLQGARNIAVDVLANAIPYIQMPHSSARLENLPLNFLMVPFQRDYFMYWGTVTTSECVHVLLWLISREPIGISAEQLECFRNLLNIEEQPLQGNFRPCQDNPNITRTVFHANPSCSLYATLLPVPRPTHLQLKKHDAEMKVERDYEMDDADIFNVEMKQDTPFKTEKNKYTISTSIKVHPELLEKLKSVPKPEKTERGRPIKIEECKKRSNSSGNKNTNDPCIFENVSTVSSNISRQFAFGKTKIPEPVYKGSNTKSRTFPPKQSQIPKRVKQ